jgi:opacity protein-like surface antigen
MFKKVLLGSLVLVVMLVSSSVSAGNYWGIGVGNASFSLKNFGVGNVEDGSALKIFAGNRSGDFGMEMEFSTSEHDWEGWGGTASHSVNNLAFSGVAYLPLSAALDLYGKLGLNLWGVSYTLGGLSSETENGVGLALGGGVDFAATQQFHLRLEYQMFTGMDDGVDKGNITQMMASGAYFF